MVHQIRTLIVNHLPEYGGSNMPGFVRFLNVTFAYGTKSVGSDASSK